MGEDLILNTDVAVKKFMNIMKSIPDFYDYEIVDQVLYALINTISLEEHSSYSAQDYCKEIRELYLMTLNPYYTHLFVSAIEELAQFLIALLRVLGLYDNGGVLCYEFGGLLNYDIKLKWEG